MEKGHRHLDANGMNLNGLIEVDVDQKLLVAVAR
jgi:hypothetical protein